MGEVKVFVNINTVPMLTCVSGILDSSNRCVAGLRDILEVTDSMAQNTQTLNHVSHTVGDLNQQTVSLCIQTLQRNTGNDCQDTAVDTALDSAQFQTTKHHQ